MLGLTSGHLGEHINNHISYFARRDIKIHALQREKLHRSECRQADKENTNAASSDDSPEAKDETARDVWNSRNIWDAPRHPTEYYYAFPQEASQSECCIPQWTSALGVYAAPFQERGIPPKLYQVFATKKILSISLIHKQA